jgi:hypothetical protein
MRLKSGRKRGYHVSTNGIGIGMLTGPADDGILLMSTIVDDRSLKKTLHLAGSGPQLACGCSKEGSPGALDARGSEEMWLFLHVRSG